MPGDSTNVMQVPPGGKPEFNESNDFWVGVLIVITIAWLIRMASRKLEPYFRRNNTVLPTSEIPAQPVTTEATNTPLVYQGNELDFSEELVDTVLKKHFPYYTHLSAPRQYAFRQRLQKFMETKTFVIHHTTGYREMPILLSATAIKLSFGLKNYLLPYYRFIHIFPAEFIGTHPTLRILAGNVSGNSIHVSWKHFLKGFQQPDDGQNLGLHEMAHAYYFQNVEINGDDDNHFAEQFGHFNRYGNKVFEANPTRTGLYTEYAIKNFQEFWAESVELFFEKPQQLKATYPELYRGMVALLSQDPAATLS